MPRKRSWRSVWRSTTVAVSRIGGMCCRRSSGCGRGCACRLRLLRRCCVSGDRSRRWSICVRRHCPVRCLPLRRGHSQPCASAIGTRSTSMGVFSWRRRPICRRGICGGRWTIGNSTWHRRSSWRTWRTGLRGGGCRSTRPSTACGRSMATWIPRAGTSSTRRCGHWRIRATSILTIDGHQDNVGLTP